MVQQELQKLGIDSCKIILGEVQIPNEVPKETLEQFKKSLDVLGFELLDNAKQQVIEKMKRIVIQKVHHSTSDEHHNFSEILSKALHKDYSYLSGLFSEVEGITIEKYIINQKIEKVKELIIYDE